MRVHHGLEVGRRILQQVQQFGFEGSVNFATTARLGGIGQPVKALLLPSVEPTVHCFRMHLTQGGKLFERKAFGRKQDGLCLLPQPMNGAIPIHLFQRRPLNV